MYMEAMDLLIHVGMASALLLLQKGCIMICMECKGAFLITPHYALLNEQPYGDCTEQTHPTYMIDLA